MDEEFLHDLGSFLLNLRNSDKSIAAKRIPAISMEK